MAQTMRRLAVLADFVPLKWHDLARCIVGHCGNKIRASVRLALQTQREVRAKFRYTDFTETSPRQKLATCLRLVSRKSRTSRGSPCHSATFTRRLSWKCSRSVFARRDSDDDADDDDDDDIRGVSSQPCYRQRVTHEVTCLSDEPDGKYRTVQNVTGSVDPSFSNAFVSWIIYAADGSHQARLQKTNPTKFDGLIRRSTTVVALSYATVRISYRRHVRLSVCQPHGVIDSKRMTVRSRSFHRQVAHRIYCFETIFRN